MSKTVSTCICETNQLQNQPQENVFFHTLYRTQADFPNEFLRTARSTSPIQICAVFSTQGPDSLGAMLNIQLNDELSKIVAAAQSQPVLDFDSFSNQVVNVLNIKVCNYVVAKGGTPLKTSMTMAIIEGDTLRVIHIGNTKAVLIRDNKIMALTEEQTVAHRYVQMGAITAEQEKDHPESMNLTQYLGKLPQDGPVVPDKKIRVKLIDNDQLCVMGIGVAKLMPAQMRNMILVKPQSTENKCRDLVTSAYNYGVKYGLTVIMINVESTFLLPGDAVINNGYAADASMGRSVSQSNVNPYDEYNDGYDNEGDADETTRFGVSSDDDEEEYSGNFGKKAKAKKEKKVKKNKDSKPSVKKDILTAVLIFVICALVSYGGMYILFNAKHIKDLFKPKTSETIVNEERVMYVVTDNTPVYAAASLESEVITTFNRGQTVTFVAADGDFCQIKFGESEGYILSMQLSDEDPTLGETLPEMQDPTPVPEETAAPAPTDAAPAPADTQAETPAQTEAVVVETTAAETTAPVVTEYEPDDAIPPETTTAETAAPETTAAPVETTA
ncbi:MAG: SH3 domain-containing protein, partial [Saccharofermentans sp.]|nr:SH3 domain-containing protein [Saccharofermentans sp.]